MNRKECLEELASLICGKPSGLDLVECHSRVSEVSHLCSSHDGCRIEEKTDSQLQYVIENGHNNVFVKACPGAGKTEVVGLKAAYEINKWNNRHSGLAVLTFTNNAANVISSRAKQFLGVNRVSSPHFIGTFDSWLHGYIGHPFLHLITKYEGKDGDRSFLLVDNDSSSPFLKAFCAHINATPFPRANQYYYDVEQKAFVFSSGDYILDRKRNGSRLTDVEGKALLKAKQKLWRNGFVTYQDVELLCYILLSKHGFAERIANRFPFIIVDECQDLSWLQMDTLRLLLENGAKVHFVGDLNQSIYGFKFVDPRKVQEFIENHDFEEQRLSDNFRSCQPIVDVTQKIISGDKVLGRHPQELDDPCVCIKYDPEYPHSVVHQFEALLLEYGIPFVDAAVLVKNWDHVDILHPSSGSKELNKPLLFATAVFLWKEPHHYVEDGISLLGRFFSESYFHGLPCSKRNYYCPSIVTSSVSWRLFLANVLDEILLNSSASDINQPWQKWAGIVRKTLPSIAKESSVILEGDLDEIDWNDFSFRALSGASKSLVVDTLTHESEALSRVRVTTVHSVKGQTLEAVLIVQPPRAQWKPWAPKKGEEEERVAYVACSRPRKLLAWGVASNSRPNIKKIKDYGFKFI